MLTHRSYRLSPVARTALASLVLALGCSGSDDGGDSTLDDADLEQDTAAVDGTSTDSARTDTLVGDTAASDSGVDSTPVDSAIGDSARVDVGGDTAKPDASSTDTRVASDTSTAPDTRVATDTSVAPDTRPEASTDAGPGPGPTMACAFTKDADGFFKLTSTASDYVVRLPPAYSTSAPVPFPLLVSLHGCGDTALNHANWSAVPYGTSRTTQSYIAVSVGGRDGTCWTVPGDTDKVMAAIAHVRSCFYVHQKRIVIAGYSSGGMLAYNVGFKNASMFAGILIENSTLRAAVGTSNVDTVLSAAAWPINVAYSARLSDTSFPIADVQADRVKMVAKGIPLVYREIAGGHGDVAGDWESFLLPKLTGWYAP